MTTRTFSSYLDHTSDAGFRAWGSELGTNFTAAGLIQAADTGQINWATVLRPAANVVGGYEIWKLPDSSLFIKLEYATGSAPAYATIWITVGTGSNGTGTLTGQLSTRNSIVNGTAASSATTVYPTYICVTNDYFLLHWKDNSVSNAYPMGQVLVGKTVGTTGVATTDGYGVLRFQGASATGFQCVRLVAPAATYNESNYFTLIPGNVSSSLVGTDIQAYQIWMNIPDIRPFMWGFVYIAAEIPDNSTVSVAVVGATAHTYLSLGLRSGSGAFGSGQNNLSIAMLYE